MRTIGENWKLSEKKIYEFIFHSGKSCLDAAEGLTHFEKKKNKTVR